MERGRERREGPTRSGFGKRCVSTAWRSFFVNDGGVVYQGDATCPIILVTRFARKTPRAETVARLYPARASQSPTRRQTSGHDHHQRRSRDLLQGLGKRTTDRLFARLAIERRRLGRADDVL